MGFLKLALFSRIHHSSKTLTESLLDIATWFVAGKVLDHLIKIYQDCPIVSSASLDLVHGVAISNPCSNMQGQ
jgi:hypothetical protein